MIKEKNMAPETDLDRVIKQAESELATNRNSLEVNASRAEVNERAIEVLENFVAVCEELKEKTAIK